MCNTNFKSVLFLTQLCVPHLIASKGVIVNNSSVSAIKSIHNVIAYGPLKAALDQFTKCLALGKDYSYWFYYTEFRFVILQLLELADKGVRANAINPGFVDTPLHHTEKGLDKDVS
jgi:NAD(P)-dependent dehydrogenase (short-subunit alcohol dehydrogenase family)